MSLGYMYTPSPTYMGELGIERSMINPDPKQKKKMVRSSFDVEKRRISAPSQFFPEVWNKSWHFSKFHM